MPEEPKTTQLPRDFSARHTDPLAQSKQALRNTLLQLYRNDLTNASWRVRRKAVSGLSTLGTEAQEAIPQLEALMQDKDWRVRKAVALALQAIRSANGQ
jgi:HEAT repeat protein